MLVWTSQEACRQPEPTVAVANTEPSLLHAEVGGEAQLHHVPRGVQRQPVGRGAAELHAGAARVHQHPVVDAARRLLQVEVQEGELHDEAGGRPQRPATRL